MRTLTLANSWLRRQLPSWACVLAVCGFSLAALAEGTSPGATAVCVVLLVIDGVVAVGVVAVPVRALSHDRREVFVAAARDDVLATTEQRDFDPSRASVAAHRLRALRGPGPGRAVRSSPDSTRPTRCTRGPSGSRSWSSACSCSTTVGAGRRGARASRRAPPTTRAVASRPRRARSRPRRDESPSRSRAPRPPRGLGDSPSRSMTATPSSAGRRRPRSSCSRRIDDALLQLVHAIVQRRGLARVARRAVAARELVEVLQQLPRVADVASHRLVGPAELVGVKAQVQLDECGHVVDQVLGVA